MAKGNQAIAEIRWQAVVDGVVADLLPSSPVTSPNNQDVTGLFNSAMDGIFACLSKKRSDVPSVLPVSNYRDGIFTTLSTKNTVNSKAAFLPVTHRQDGKLEDLWTESQGSKPTILPGGVVPRDGLLSDLWEKASSSSSVTAKNNQTHPQFRCQPEWDLDGMFAEFSKKSTPLFYIPGKPTVRTDPDHPDKKRHKATLIDPPDSKEPIQKIVSYPKVGLVEPPSEQPDGCGICQSDFKNFVVEDYPHPKDENSMCFSDFNEDQDDVEYANLALEDYSKQTELVYELVEIVKVSVTGLGGFLYHITFKSMSPQKELITFEAEVFNIISKRTVWRVGIRKPGSDWFDGKLYWPKYKPCE